MPEQILCSAKLLIPYKPEMFAVSHAGKAGVAGGS